MTQKFGLSAALTTPFKTDGTVDIDAMIAHARRCLQNGCDSVTLFGTTGERGSVMGGISYTNQKISYVRDYPWSDTVAGSSYSNNYLKVLTAADGSTIPGSSLYTNNSSVVPGGCSGTNFYETTNSAGRTSCLYNYVGDMADTASIKNKNLFLRSEYALSDAWTINADIYVNRKNSTSVYAPVPESIFVSADSPNNTTGQDAYIKHRFAALDKRYTYTDENSYDVNLSLHGQLTDSTSVAIDSWSKPVALRVRRASWLSSMLGEW